MNDFFRSVVQSVIQSRIAIAGILGALSLVGLASVSLVSAQTAELRISELQCNDNPEVVRITNQGAGDQDLAGWTLRSDPVGTESFDLTVIGVLASGVSIFVESGPAAQGSYVWSTEFVLRDSDATDFARIVNASGTVVHEVKCQTGSVTPATSVTPPPTATAAPATVRPAATVAPTATAPTAAPVGVVPNGGGPPGAGSWQGGGLMFIGGAWLLAAVFGVVVLSRMRSDRAQAVPISIAGGRSPAGLPSPLIWQRKGRWVYLVLVLILTALAGWSESADGGRRRR